NVCRAFVVCASLVFFIFLFFFFSSRRRHTRSKRDWSSDVCSSDLFWASDYLAQKAAMAVLGLLVPPVVGMMLVAAGMSLAPTWAMGAWMVFALVLWTAPDLEIRDQARERSDHMRHTVAAVCDLVVIALAGGAGVDGALSDATRTADTGAMKRLRTSLQSATLRHEPPWSALQDLGERYQVPAATELAASLRLAGADG